MKTVAPSRQFERERRRAGYRQVIGLDEVGRGPLAGPVVVGAVVLPERCRLPEVRDCKQLSPGQRVRAAVKIRRVATCLAVGWASSIEIDRLGLTAALGLAGERALQQLPQIESSVILLDGGHNYLGANRTVVTHPRADQHSLVVAAASIAAKVARDRYMELVARRYPEYGFESHKGYGVERHLEALRRLGPTPQHRRLFAPISQLASVER